MGRRTKSEDRAQKTEDGGQRSEVRGQMALFESEIRRRSQIQSKNQMLTHRKAKMLKAQKLSAYRCGAFNYSTRRERARSLRSG